MLCELCNQAEHLRLVPGIENPIKWCVVGNRTPRRDISAEIDACDVIVRVNRMRSYLSNWAGTKCHGVALAGRQWKTSFFDQVKPIQELIRWIEVFFTRSEKIAVDLVKDLEEKYNRHPPGYCLRVIPRSEIYFPIPRPTTGTAIVLYLLDILGPHAELYYACGFGDFEEEYDPIPAHHTHIDLERRMILGLRDLGSLTIIDDWTVVDQKPPPPPETNTIFTA